MGDAPVVEAERDAGVDRVQEGALALDPEQLAAARASLDDEPLGRTRKEVGDDRVDRDSPAGDRHARLAGRDEDRAQPSTPRFQVELAGDGHLPDRAVGPDREHDRRVDNEVLPGCGGEIRRRPPQVAQLDTAVIGERVELGVVTEKDVQTVLDVESVLDTGVEELHPLRRETPALRHDPDERGRRPER